MGHALATANFSPATSGGFLPSQLSGIQDWWRSDSGITTATGVSHWVGKVNGIDLAQATGANQPSFNATDANFNGRPSLTGNGTSQVLTTSSNLTMGTTTAFVWFVGRQIAGAANNEYFAIGPSAVPQFELRGTGASNGQPQVFNTITGQSGTAWGSSIIGATKAVYCYTSGTVCGVNVSNGIEVDAAVTSATFTANPMAIFGRQTSLFMNLALAEIIVCNVLPSSTQLAALEAYAQGLYGAGV